MKPPVFSSTDLELLQRQLQSWRQQQSGRHCLPQELWDAAGRLAARQGVSLVSRTLQLGFHRIRLGNLLFTHNSVAANKLCQADYPQDVHLCRYVLLESGCELAFHKPRLQTGKSQRTRHGSLMKSKPANFRTSGSPVDLVFFSA